MATNNNMSELDENDEYRYRLNDSCPGKNIECYLI